MQEAISNQLPVIQRLTSINYWVSLLLNGTATFFLDESQLDLLKAMLVMVLPVLAVYAKVKVSELTGFVGMVFSAVTVEGLCHAGCGS